MKKEKDQNKASILWKIFFVTFKLGAFTFGGGYAMIPLMQREFVEKNGWINDTDIVDIFAVAQSVPGVIAVNSSVMIGYRIAGVAGALMAALGVTLPSLIVMCLVTTAYRQIIDNPWVQAAMRGVRAGVVALIVSAVIRMAKDGIKDIWQWVFGVAALGLAVTTGFSAIWIIIGGGIAGLAVSMIRRRKEDKA